MINTHWGGVVEENCNEMHEFLTLIVHVSHDEYCSLRPVTLNVKIENREVTFTLPPCSVAEIELQLGAKT